MIFFILLHKKFSERSLASIERFHKWDKLANDGKQSIKWRNDGKLDGTLKFHTTMSARFSKKKKRCGQRKVRRVSPLRGLLTNLMILTIRLLVVEGILLRLKFQSETASFSSSLHFFNQKKTKSIFRTFHEEQSICWKAIQWQTSRIITLIIM